MSILHLFHVINYEDVLTYGDNNMVLLETKPFTTDQMAIDYMASQQQ